VADKKRQTDKSGCQKEADSPKNVDSPKEADNQKGAKWLMADKKM